MANDIGNPRESGTQLHKRETRWQIWLPFWLVLILVIIGFLVVALPSDPVWRIRAQAMGDWLYSILCLVPLTICLLPVFILIMLGIFGMNRLHDSAEAPLRRVENLAEYLAGQIQVGAAFINKQTISFNSRLAPLMNAFSGFDEAQEDMLEVKEEAVQRKAAEAQVHEADAPAEAPVVEADEAELREVEAREVEAREVEAREVEAREVEVLETDAALQQVYEQDEERVRSEETRTND